MFYEKLAEVKRDKKREGLSAGQKIGVGATGLLASALSKRTATQLFFPWESTAAGDLKIRTDLDKRLRALNNAGRVVSDGKIRTYFQDGTFDDKHTLRNVQVGDIFKTPRSGDGIVRITDDVKHELDQLLKAPDPWKAPLNRKLREQYETEAMRKRELLSNKAHRRTLIRHGMIGLGAAYGAKKLYDRYNARKRQRD